MKTHLSFTAFLTGLCCACLCLCACSRSSSPEKTVDQETFNLMQKTQAELAACAERCRSKAEESKDREILLALANSQQILADRHETIIKSLLRKKYKLEKVSTVSYPIEMDPRMLVLDPPEEYKKILSSNPKTCQEILIALEITNKVLKDDQVIQTLIDPYSEGAPDVDFYLCPICGRLETEQPEGNCPVCNTEKTRFIELQNGELPPRKEESYIFVSD